MKNLQLTLKQRASYKAYNQLENIVLWKTEGWSRRGSNILNRMNDRLCQMDSFKNRPGIRVFHNLVLTAALKVFPVFGILFFS